MANNTHKNIVIYNGNTLIDLSSDTVTSPYDIIAGKVGHLANGAIVTGLGSETLDFTDISASGDGNVTIEGSSGTNAYTRTVIVPQQTITPTLYSNPNTGGTYYHASLTHLDGLEEGADYIITYNNNEYDSTCVILYSTNYTLGSIHYFFGSSGAYPFGIVWENNTDTFEFAINSASQVTVKIEKLDLLNSGTLLSSKSITENGTYNASTDNLDGYSSVTVNVPTGSVSPTLQTKTNISPSTSSQTITADTGYDGLGSVQINAMPSGSATPASSISATGATVSTGTNTLTLSKTVSNTPQVSAGYVSSGTAGNSSVSLTASVNTRSSSDLTASGATVTAPAGYYGEAATKTVASGTEGTPTATKGTVSNHSVSVTPSVTNTVGYITGGTKTGTAITVTASELASGNKEITSNGTNIDVVGYSTVSVAVASSSKNVQIAQSTTRRSNTSLGSITSLTCSTAGTYHVYWTCARSNTSQTWGSQLYINDTAYGTENTTWSNNVQTNHLTGVALSANDTVAVYGRSRSGYYIYAPQLTIVQA